ncbi:MAG: DNA-processing protein DprA [Microbacteriaceae bacterium]
MSVAGVPEAQFAPLLRAITDEALPVADLAERFARAAWTVVAEPGDRDTGVLLAAVGPVRALELVVSGADAEAIADEVARGGDREPDVDTWTEALKRWRPRADPQAALLTLRQAGRFGMRLLTPGDEHWPQRLDDLQEHAPFALWARGDVGRLAALERSIALVGARAATGYGEHVTIELASGLVDRGFAIVSGAAYGVDGAAHRAALASRGTTVAVLAGGLDRFYPSGHEQLLTRIVDRGVALSEVPPGTTPTKWRFLLRNRLIAALSDAVVVVEAGWRSGSLNTAGHAGTLGRPLGAVPGPVTSAASSGCHRLLREYAAVCVTTADEAAELAGITGRPAAQPDHAADVSGTRLRVLDAVHERTPRRVERIAALSGLAPDRVRAELGLLELEGFVLERPSGWTRRKEG